MAASNVDHLKQLKKGAALSTSLSVICLLSVYFFMGDFEQLII